MNSLRKEHINEPTTIYGCSDDLIEFTGELYGEVSLSATEKNPLKVKVSDGTELEVFYEKNYQAIWGIKVIKKGSQFEKMTECHNEDDERYSDTVYFKPSSDPLAKPLTAEYSSGKGWKKVK